MSVNETHLVMLGVKLDPVHDRKFFYEDQDEGEMTTDKVLELPYRLNKDKEIRQHPVVVVSGEKYLVAGRILDYAQPEEGESLAFTVFHADNMPARDEDAEATFNVLKFCGVEIESPEDMAYFVFTHIS